MMPIHKRLFELTDNDTDNNTEEIDSLLVKGEVLHAVKSALSLFSFAAGLWVLS